MSTNSKYVYFTINGSKVCLFDIYTNEVLKEINIPSVIKDKELIITMFAIPAAAVMMDVSAVVYKYQLMPHFKEYMDLCAKDGSDMVA